MWPLNGALYSPSITDEQESITYKINNPKLIYNGGELGVSLVIGRLPV